MLLFQGARADYNLFSRLGQPPRTAINAAFDRNVAAIGADPPAFAVGEGKNDRAVVAGERGFDPRMEMEPQPPAGRDRRRRADKAVLAPKIVAADSKVEPPHMLHRFSIDAEGALDFQKVPARVLGAAMGDDGVAEERSGRLARLGRQGRMRRRLPER